LHTKEQRYLKAIEKENKCSLFLYGYFENKTKKHFFSYYNMNTLNTVFRKLAKEENKTELASYKIELNILQNAQDVLKALKKAKSNSFKQLDKLTKNGEKYAEQINKIKGNYQDEIIQVEKILLKELDVKSAISALKRIEDTAKDLGLKASEVPVYKKLSKELDGAEDLTKDLKDFLNDKYSNFTRKIKF